jgi:hypothetical protein
VQSNQPARVFSRFTQIWVHGEGRPNLQVPNGAEVPRLFAAKYGSRRGLAENFARRHHFVFSREPGFWYKLLDLAGASRRSGGRGGAVGVSSMAYPLRFVRLEEKILA